MIKWNVEGGSFVFSADCHVLEHDDKTKKQSLPRNDDFAHERK